MSTLSRFFSANVYQVCIHVCLVGLIGIVIVLSRQNAQLKAETSINADPLRVGDSIAFGSITAINGQSVDSTSSRKLIVIFTTKCQFCRKSVQAWQALAREGPSTGLRVIGISLDSADATLRFATELGIAFPVFSVADPKQFKQVNHISAVPVTLVCSRQSRVEKMWLGVISQDVLAEIQNHISASSKNLSKEAI